MTNSNDESRTAGRGVASITGAKLYFILSSYGVQILLPRFLGSAESFGLFSTAMNVISILNNVLIAATVQSVSKLVSEDETRAGTTLRQGLWLQSLVGGVLFVGIMIASPFVARDVLLDAQLGPMLQIASAVVLSYALYAALVGSLNGRRRFQKQAALDITFSTLRTFGMLLAAGLGFGALGAVAGFASAAVAILVVALFVVGVGEKAGPIPWRRWLSFMAPLWLYQAFLNGIMQIDLAVLKRTVAQLSMASGVTPEAAAETASVYAGYYRAAQTFAFVPYQLILSVTFVVFPLVSRATSAGDLETTRNYIRSALRFSLLVLLAVAAPIAGAAAGVMRIAYPSDYLSGAGALGTLIFGQVAFALFVISSTVLSGAGRPTSAAVIAGIALSVVVVATRGLIGFVGLGDNTLLATALGTTLGTLVALVAVGLTLYRVFGAFIPIGSAARAALAAIAAFFAARLLPSHSALLALVALAVGFGAYVAALFVTRELRQDHVQLALGFLRRRR